MTFAPSTMLGMLNAFLTVQALHTAAVLEIPDLLAGGPLSIDRLAADTGADRPSLYRLLRMLAGADVLREEADQHFSLTSLGETLRRDAPNSVRDWALYVGAPETWEAWGRLPDAVMTGEPGFVLAHGMSTYDFLTEHQELGATFDRWMTRQSEQHNDAIVAAYDFSPFATVADIGGGEGSMLAAILRAYPSARGLLFDLPQVVERAASLDATNVAGRCDIVGGDMLAGVPEGADLYVIKRTLMIWGDDQSVQTLRNCAAVLPPGGRVLVIEMLMPPANEPSPARSFDVLMLLANKGGQIRTEDQFRELFAAAGLRLTRAIPTTSPNMLLEGVPA